MASIPLPALAVQQQPSVIDQYMKGMQLRQMQQQQALVPGQQQEQQQRIQANDLGIQEKQKQMEDQAKIEKIFSDAGGDPDAIKATIPKIMAVNPALGIQFQKNLMESDTADIAHKKAVIGYHSDVAGRVAQVAGSAKDQHSYESAIGELLNEHTIDAKTAAQFLSQPFDPAKVDQIRQQALSVKDQLEQQDKAITQKETERHNRAEEKKVPVDQQEANAWLARPENAGKDMSDYAKWKSALAPTATFNVNNQAGGGLSSTALDQAATRYNQTGVLPSMGMGAAGAASRKAIMNRAAEMFPEGSITANSAEYKANQASYTNVTKTLDTLSAFESSGLKNLKQFTDLASKLPDTGVPWLNTPVRNLDKNLVGAEYMPAIEAARSVALREIARVTNDPKLSGALTDTARKEVSDLSPTSATLPQIKHVVEVLTADMANVHSGLAEQKADIEKRLGIAGGGSQGGGPAASKAAPPSGATHIGIGSADKKKHYLDANGKDLGLAE